MTSAVAVLNLGKASAVVGHHGTVALRPNGGENRQCDVPQAVAVFIYVDYTVAVDARNFMGGTCLSGP